jgi:putative FmdB family regulatory protein
MRPWRRHFERLMLLSCIVLCAIDPGRTQRDRKSAGKTSIIQGFGRFFAEYFMPIYAYRCEACGFAKDVLQKMSDDVLTICPSCSKASFKKQLTAAGFQLKGSGWYVTDFRGNGSGGANSAGATGTALAAAEPSASSSDNAASATTAAAPATTAPAATPAAAAPAASTPSAS